MNENDVPRKLALQKAPRFFPLRKCFNYAYVMQTLLPLLKGSIDSHVSLLNAIFNCPDYDDEKKRLIKGDHETSAFLSEMLHDKRNPPKKLVRYMADGIPQLGDQIPTAETFKMIAESKLGIAKENQEYFRDMISECYANDKSQDFTPDVFEILERITKNRTIDFYHFVFHSIRCAILCKNNSAYKGINRSEVFPDIGINTNALATGFITVKKERPSYLISALKQSGLTVKKPTVKQGLVETLGIDSHLHVEIAKCDSLVKMNGVISRMISPSVGITGYRQGIAGRKNIIVEGVYQQSARVITTGNLQKYGVSGKQVGRFMSGKAIGIPGVQNNHPSTLAHIEVINL
jgi:hypothetical protein